MVERFAGFPDSGIEFLAGLCRDNTRAYFDAHRATSKTALLEPMRLFVTDVAEKLRSVVAPAVQAEPTVGKSLFRINRDTRFSKDKTPYHPWVDAIWWEGHADARRAPAFIFRLAADHIVVGAGVMAFRDGWLVRYRDAVASDETGEALQAALDHVSASHGGTEISRPTRKRVPSPHPADHPRGDLLRLDGVHVSRRLPHPRERSTPRFASWTAAKLAEFASVHRWLIDNLT